MRQAGNEVKVEIGDAGVAQSCNIVENCRAIVQATDRRSFLIHERLHAQAHAVDVVTAEKFDHGRGQRAGSTFDRDFGLGLDVEILPNRDKKALQLAYIKDGGSSSAEVNGVDGSLHRAAHLCGGGRSLGNVVADAINVALKNGLGKNIRSEVAIGTLGTAERDGNVEAERHGDDYATCEAFNRKGRRGFAKDAKE